MTGFRPSDFKLLIGIHTHGHITPPFAQSLAILTGQLGAWGVTHGVAVVQDCFVTSGRDRLAATCMQQGFSHLLFLDADIEFTPQDVAQLLAADKDVVAGAYRKKNSSGQFALSFIGTADSGAAWDDEAQAMEVDGIGAGFLLVRRAVFERLATEMPDIRFVEEGEDGTETEAHAFFEQRILSDGHRASEDILFCRRWRALGGKVWVLPCLRLKHWGPVAFEGALADEIRLVEPG